MNVFMFWLLKIGRPSDQEVLDSWSLLRSRLWNARSDLATEHGWMVVFSKSMKQEDDKGAPEMALVGGW